MTRRWSFQQGAHFNRKARKKVRFACRCEPVIASDYLPGRIRRESAKNRIPHNKPGMSFGLDSVRFGVGRKV